MPSYRSVLQHTSVQIVALSRFLSRMGGQTLSYGIMVFLAAAGASQLEISLANSASFLAALLFGLQGGLLADSRPKRQILMLGFAVQALLCFVIPFTIGTDIGALLFVIFVTSAITQVVTPGMKSIVAIVSTPAEVATTGALVNIIGSLGSAVGSAFIAPVLIRSSGIEAILIAAGILFSLSAVRIYRLPVAERKGRKAESKRLRDLNWKPQALSLKYNAEWIMANRPVASMLLVGGLSGALYQGINTLFPVYVREVLHADPTNSIFIYAPSGIGYLIGAFGSPWLIRWFGERRVAVWSLVMMAIGMTLLGGIDLVAAPLSVVSPLRLLDVFLDTPLSQPVLAAGVAAIPANLGSTAASQAVQVYVNRNVPVRTQGGIFGLEQVQENGLNLVSVFLLGLVATVTGPQYVFLFAPVVVTAVVFGLLRYAVRHTTGETPEFSESIDFFVEDVPPQKIKQVRSSRKRRKSSSR
ncbi:MAG: MFS transporter [Thermomicrobiales bacterium]|nr:MFS transporter [Thermomicrobiales bacterium]